MLSYENSIRISFKFYGTYATGYAVYLGEDAADNSLQNLLVDITKAVSFAERLERIRNILPSFIREEGTAYYDRFRGDILIPV